MLLLVVAMVYSCCFACCVDYLFGGGCWVVCMCWLLGDFRCCWFVWVGLVALLWCLLFGYTGASCWVWLDSESLGWML